MADRVHTCVSSVTEAVSCHGAPTSASAEYTPEEPVERAVHIAEAGMDAESHQDKVRRTGRHVEEKDECRLCLEEVLEGATSDGGGRLVRPCRCRSAVHVECLERWRVAQQQRDDRSSAENAARAATCEVCGSLWSVDGQREVLPTQRAICRAHGGDGKVALRRVPTAARENGVFSEFSAKEGQELDVLELDRSGEFFRVRASDAERYHGHDSVAVAEGWIRRCYLEWPGVSPDASTAATRTHLRRFFSLVGASQGANAAGIETSGDDQAAETSSSDEAAADTNR